ncbi:MAG: hypothetical protein IJ488_05070 [Clostridia bacterium]|nr:hypothetical protein [Clostridia bacterium]
MKQLKCTACGNENTNARMKICPICGAKLPKPIYKKWWFWLLIVFSVVIISSIAGASSSDNNAGKGSSGSSNVNTTTYTEVNLQTIIDELEENAMKAEATYEGKYIKFKAKIKSIDSDGYSITVEPTTADEWNILDRATCYIKTDAQTSFIMNKSVGDTVVIKGKVKSVGDFGGYYINIDSIENP